MKFLISCALIISASFTIPLAGREEKPFAIVLRGYNDRAWIKESLDSIIRQKYDNYRVLFISDAPGDGTDLFVRDYIKEKGVEERFTLLTNKKTTQSLACLCKGASLVQREEIVVDMSGRHWLAHEWALQTLNEIYDDPEVWMTYGQFIYYPDYKYGFAKEIPSEIIENNLFRTLRGYITLPRTFYGGLFHQIDREELLFEGRFIKAAGSLAYTFPMAEMAGCHIRFNPEVIYTFNYSYPFPDDWASSEMEKQMEEFIRDKTPYLPLASLRKGHLRIYDQISNLENPQNDDYRFIQDYLSFGQRSELVRLRDMEQRARSFKLIGDSNDEIPSATITAVNCGIDQRENCIILYSSFNRNYIKGLKRVVDMITNSNYRGHIFYRIGGWPFTTGGGMTLAHVPYAFKPCLFKEAENLGYKRVLWLDTSVIPLVCMNQIFSMIEEDGYFVMGNTVSVGPFTTARSATFFGLNLEDTFEIPSCSSGLFGVDFTQKIGRDIIEHWYRAAEDEDAFYTPRPDQSSLSIILHQLGVTKLTPIERLPHCPEEVREDSLFLIEKEYIR